MPSKAELTKLARTSLEAALGWAMVMLVLGAGTALLAISWKWLQFIWSLVA